MASNDITKLIIRSRSSLSKSEPVLLVVEDDPDGFYVPRKGELVVIPGMPGAFKVRSVLWNYERGTVTAWVK